MLLALWNKCLEHWEVTICHFAFGLIKSQQRPLLRIDELPQFCRLSVVICALHLHKRPFSRHLSSLLCQQKMQQKCVFCGSQTLFFWYTRTPTNRFNTFLRKFTPSFFCFVFSGKKSCLKNRSNQIQPFFSILTILFNPSWAIFFLSAFISVWSRLQEVNPSQKDEKWFFFDLWYNRITFISSDSRLYLQGGDPNWFNCQKWKRNRPLIKRYPTEKRKLPWKLE